MAVSADRIREAGKLIPPRPDAAIFTVVTAQLECFYHGPAERKEILCVAE
jgi:hypothetical protein